MDYGRVCRRVPFFWFPTLPEARYRYKDIIRLSTPAFGCFGEIGG